MPIRTLTCAASTGSRRRPPVTGGATPTAERFGREPSGTVSTSALCRVPAACPPSNGSIGAQAVAPGRALRRAAWPVRERHGRNLHPSAVVLDSQSVKSSEEIGYDAANASGPQAAPGGRRPRTHAGRDRALRFGAGPGRCRRVLTGVRFSLFGRAGLGRRRLGQRGGRSAGPRTGEPGHRGGSATRRGEGFQVLPRLADEVQDAWRATTNARPDHAGVHDLVRGDRVDGRPPGWRGDRAPRADRDRGRTPPSRRPQGLITTTPSEATRKRPRSRRRRVDAWTRPRGVTQVHAALRGGIGERRGEPVVLVPDEVEHRHRSR
jgi:hypothetical protein